MSTHGDLRSATASSAWTGCGVLFACNTFVVFFLENWEHSVDIFSTTFLLNRVVCKCKKRELRTTKAPPTNAQLAFFCALGETKRA
jgi:hypothetical protein